MHGVVLLFPPKQGSEKEDRLPTSMLPKDSHQMDAPATRMSLVLLKLPSHPLARRNMFRARNISETL